MTDAARTPFSEQDDEELTPKAAPVDTFVQAQKPQDLTPNLTSLLKGLSEFDTGVQSFIDKQDSDGKANAEAQAKYDALRESAGLPASSPAGNSASSMFGGIFSNLFGTDATPLKTPALPSAVTAPPVDPNAAPTSPAITPTSAGPAVPSPDPVSPGGTPGSMLPTMNAPLPPARPDQETVNQLAAGQTEPAPEDAPAPSIMAPAGVAPPSTSATEGTPNAAGLAIGVGQGLLPAQANPAYAKQLQQSRGELAGEQMRQRMTMEAQQAGIGSMDMDTYLGWRKNWLAANLGSSMSPDTMRGLVPQLDAAMKTSLQQYTVERDKYLKEAGTQAQGAQFNQVLDAANQPVGQGQSLDVQGTYDQLTKVRAAWMAVNQDPAKADHQFITAVTAQAVKTGNKDYLSILDQPVPGKDYTYAQTTEGRAAYGNTSDAIDQNKAADDKAALQAQAAQDKAYEKGVTGQAMDFIQKNPGMPVPDTIVNDPRMKTLDPEFPQKMAELGKKYAGDHGPQDDPAHVAQVERDIINAGPGAAQSYFHLHMGELNNPETITRLNTLAENADKGGPKLQEVLKDPAYKTYRVIVTKALGDPTKFDVFNADLGASPESAERNHQMDMAVLAWAAKHPTADYLATQDAIDNIGQAFTRGLPKQTVATALGTPAAPPAPDIPPGQTTPRAPAPVAPTGRPDTDPALPTTAAPAAPAKPAQKLDPDGDPVLPYPDASTAAPGAAPANPSTAAPRAAPAKPSADAMVQALMAGQLAPGSIEERQAMRAREQQMVDAYRRLPPDQQMVEAYRRLSPDQQAVIAMDAKAAGYATPEQYVAAHTAKLAPAPTAPAAPAKPAESAGVVSGGGVVPMAYTQPDPNLPTPAKGSDAEALTNAAHQLGTTPRDLATVIAYESGFRPNIRGGKGGNYTGLIQFGPEEAAKYGVTGNESFSEQMPKVVQYLRDRGYKPGMSLMDLYSTINAGSPGHYHASDGNGTVSGHVANMETPAMQAKVEKFLGGKGATLGVPVSGVIDPATRKLVPGGYEPNAPAAQQPLIEAAADPAQVASSGAAPGGSSAAQVEGSRAISPDEQRAAAQEAADTASRKRRRRPGKDSGVQQA